MGWRIHQEVAAEVEATARWYEEQLKGLGLDFLHELRATLAELSAAPTISTDEIVPLYKTGDGIVHRDLNPGNLFVTGEADGTPLVKVLDFGISKSTAGSDMSVTASMTMLGSPR